MREGRTNGLSLGFGSFAIMPNTIRLALVLHNHQPIGNFDGVIEQAYQESYRPFLEVFRQFPSLRIGLHTSGSLMEWLAARHPEYLDELAELVAGGRIEIVGGAYYEPILSMIPKRDCVGQIRSYTQWLEARLGGKVRGMWIPERVWEPTMVSDLVEAGIEYTVLDDFHFRNAGLAPEQLDGYFISENDGEILAVFPGSERLRYTIPFQDPQATIDYLRGIAERRPDAVVVFGDDGEKFGSWPETFRHVYQDGWLHRFFAALVANEDWLRTTTLAEAIDNVPPNGKIYLPDSSYREMTEWALPSAQLMEYERLRHDLEHDPRWPSLVAICPRRLLAELQGEVSRSRRDVHADADGQPSPGRGRAAGPEPPPGRRGPHGALPRAVQLQLLARRIWRDLSAPSAQRGLSRPDRGRQPARSGGRPGRNLDRGRGRRFQSRRPPRGLPGQRQAGHAHSPLARRPDVRAGRSRDLPQSAGHARPPARGLSPQGAGRRQAPAIMAWAAFTIASSSSSRI